MKKTASLIDIKIIRDGITTARDNLADVKAKLTDHVNNVAKADEILTISDEIFSHLEKKTIPQTVTYSGVNTVNNIVQATGEFTNQLVNDLGSSTNELGTIVDTARYLAGVGLSGVTLAHPSMNPVEWNELSQKIEVATDRISVENNLRSTDPYLVSMYQNAWSVKGYLREDKERQPTSNIREIIYQLLHKFAPNHKIKQEPWYTPDPSSTTGITHIQRIKYIAQRVSDQNLGKQLGVLASDYSRLLTDLSKTVHKHSAVNEQEATNDLYRADALLRLLLRCLETLH